MDPGVKNAWVTVVADDTSMRNSIVLAKSLARVVTTADTVVLISNDIFHSVKGKNLFEYFDVVLPQLMDPANVTDVEHLKSLSCNLQMYSTCIVLSPNKMIVKNCDELFNLDKDFAAVALENHESELDTSVFVIRPKFYFHSGLSKPLGLSAGHNCLSDNLKEFLSHEEHQGSVYHLPRDYNYNISNSLPLIKGLHTAKIIDLGNVQLLKKEIKNNSFAKEIVGGWISFHENVLNNVSVGSFNESSSASCVKNNYKNGIAIVGQSCRFPGANNTEEFWELLKSGGDGICQIPPERLFDFQQNDQRYTESCGGFLKCPIDEFDANFFGISPREATYMDPQQRLLLEIAWEALENAAINPHSLKGGSTGVFSGVWTHDYERLVVENASALDFHHVILGNAFSATSARVSYFLGLNGPNIAVESGCSSSMISLHLACESLRKGETNLCLVLGANILAIPLPYCAIPFLANDGHCKTFDEKADGFGRAEGIAGIVLKRLPDAIKDGDRILGIIRGSGVTNEGTTCSFGTPSRHCQEIAVREALKNAKVNPKEVDYVEAHGTGTPVGDPIEFGALSAAYAVGQRENPLLVGSVKTNTGHTESAAGLAGVIKVLLSMQHEIIPPHRNFNNLNPNINLDLIPAKIPVECEKWSRKPERARIAGVSSFGISGANVHAIIEEPPVLNDFFDSHSSHINQTHQIFTISAKSENALTDLSKKYIEYFERNPSVDLADVAYTANNGRGNFKIRNAFVVTNVKELISSLETNTYEPPPLKSVKPKVAFLFTGQGSQYAGMGKEFYESNAVFRNSFDQCEAYLLRTNGISLKNAIWDETSQNLLEQTIFSQLSIFVVEVSLLKLYESFEIKADFVLGHSIGEYAAIVAAGILEVEDALDLIVERGKLVDTLPEGGMLAIKSSKDIVEQLITEFLALNPDLYIDIAGVNSPNEVVVAGSNSAVLLFEDFCVEKGKQMQKLVANRGFHSRAMDSILPQFQVFSNKFIFKSSNCFYVSGMTGEVLAPGEISSSYWAKHMRETVNFEKGMETLYENGCNVFVEIGSHPVLLALGMSNRSYTDETIWLPSLRRKESCWKIFLESLGKFYVNGSHVNWTALDLFGFRKKLELPTYPFQRKKYWTECHYADNLNKIHPILGSKVVLADHNVNIYENELNLKDFLYLKDHQVSNLIIFPAAGFLEIVVGCSIDIFKESSNKGLTIMEFSVEAPFELEEGKKYKIQTMVHPSDNDDKIKLQIFVFQSLHSYNNEKGWKLFAGAILASESISSPNIEQALLSGQKIEEIKLRCESEYSASEMYKYSSEIGLNFGQCFQSIKNVWKGKDEFLVEIPVPLKENNVRENYIYHPTVLDAMIQAQALSVKIEDKDLYLPVFIEKFTSITKCENSQRFFGHVIFGDGLNGKVFLYNESSVLLAVMEGIRLVRTSVNSFLNIINRVKNGLPGMYQEIWRSRDGPLQSRVDLSFTASQDSEVAMGIQRSPGEVEYKNFADNYDDEFCSCHILKFLFDQDWHPKVNEIVNCRSFMTDRGFLLSFERLIHRFFEILSEDGLLQRKGSNEWTVIHLPTLEEVNENIDKLDKALNDMKTRWKFRHVTIEITEYCMTQLRQVCLGKVAPHSVLFGNDDPELNALKIFTEGMEVKYANKAMSLIIQDMFKDRCTKGKNVGPVLRIIEVGAGSGATTKEVITRLKSSGIPFRYTFTDISPHFINEAKIKFANEGNIDYKILDIEKDPLLQNFPPHHYDVVLASNVLHATAVLHDSVKNVRLLLRNSGIFLLQEMLGPCRCVDLIYGILEGYWKFTDYDVRPNHPFATKEIWDRVFLESGFSISNNLSVEDVSISLISTRVVDSFDITRSINYQSKNNWFLYCDTDGVYERLKEMLNSIGRNVYLIKDITDFKNIRNETNCFYIDGLELTQVEDSLNEIFSNGTVEGFCYLRSISDHCWDNQQRICVPILNIVKCIISHSRNISRICVATTGVYYTSTNQKIVSPHKSTLVGMLKSASNELGTWFAKLIDLDPDCNNVEIKSVELFHELFTEDDCICSYRNNRKFVMRLCKIPKPNAPLTLPHGRYAVVRPKSKRIDDLQFRTISKCQLRANDIEILVKATAVNFRDLFVVLQPEQFKSAYECIGTDFSGVVSGVGASVTKHCVGDKVFGISNNSCAASHVVVDERMAIAMPNNFTFPEACTLPSVFLTAYYCMVGIANIKTEETILIHVASGGVGLVAIQIAKKIGARVIATAGSCRKRTYLRSIGVENVFHSRDLTYEEEIKKVTDGEGVDIVLNSLTGPGFKEATLRSCRTGARFVEIGKVNIWKPEEVGEIRPDVKYTIVDLETMDESKMNELVEIMERSKFSILPLPYSKFPLCLIRDALNYFAKSEHIGKVVLTMPEIKEINGRHYPSHFNFDTFATYLITGGLSGIGLEVAKWMVDCGAKCLVLIARSSPTDDTLRILEILKRKCCRIEIFKADIGDWEQCSQLFETIQSPKYKLPPLKGIIHSAAVLSDGMLRDQTWEKFKKVFNAKVSGGWNLHRLSQHISLDYFVMFSSMANLIGSYGQSNYAAASMYLDALVYYRHSIGLPAQTIDWGAWATVGKSSGIDAFNKGTFGITFFSPSQGIAALNFIMSRPNLRQVGVVQLSVPELTASFRDKGNYLSELIVEDENAITIGIATSEAFWSEINPLDLPERVTYIKKYIEKIIKRTLRLPESDYLDEYQNFSDMGLDSLMAVEIKNKLQNICGKKLTLNATSLLDHPTIHGLSQYLAEQTLSAVDSVSAPKIQVANDEELLKRDFALPMDIQCLNDTLRSLETKNILLTGSTGRLGVYILKDLLKLSHLNVYCLIRGKSNDQARKKLTTTMKQFQLQKDISIDKVSIVLGNIAEDQLGFTQEIYNELSIKIDYVIHLAIKANHVEKYVKPKSGTTDIRSVNVLGTVNILRFASNIKTKRVFYSSTYSTVNRLGDDGFVYEDFPEEDNCGDQLSMGYVLTKFVCEKLLKQANERGIPCTVVRYLELTGDSHTGLFSIDSNSFMNFLQMCVRYGAITDIDGGWCFMPVDIASQLTVNLLFSDHVETGVYNFTPPFPMFTQDFVEVMANVGFQLDIVSPDEMERKILSNKGIDAWVSIIANAYGNDLKSAILNAAAVTSLLKDKKRVYRISNKLLKANPNFQNMLPDGKKVLYAYLNYAQKSGILKDLQQEKHNNL